MGAFHVSSTTVPFNLTGNPALSMRFGTTGDGMPIAVQLAASLHAESTILHAASLLEAVSPVRDRHPALRQHSGSAGPGQAAGAVRLPGRSGRSWPPAEGSRSSGSGRPCG